MALKEIPVLERKVAVETQSTPDFQSTFQNLAESQNSLSALGAKVAQSASNQMAEQLGYEAGKNPSANEMPSITEFDKHFTESYHTQAQATLSLQAQKLFDDTHIQMSQARNLTPQLIDQAHNQLQEGLSKIASNAPTAIRGDLESTFASQLMRQTTQYREKLITQQRQDQSNMITNSLDLYAKNAYESARNGDLKDAANKVQAAKKLADNAVANRYKTPQEARVAYETIEQAALNGHYGNLALQAHKEGKYAEFEKNYAEHKPEGMTNEQWVNTGKSFISEVNFVNNLTKQDESLRLAKFNLAIAERPTEITPQEILDLKNNVSPEEFVNAQIKHIQASNKANGLTTKAMKLAGSLSDKNSFSTATEKEKNAAFDLNVNRYLQTSLQEGKNVTPAEAQLHIAMSAAGTIPKYINLLKSDLGSTNPDLISSAGESVERMYQSGNAQKLTGLGDAPLAMYEKFQALRTSMPDVEAAQKAHEIVYGKTLEQKQANDRAWTDFVKQNIKKDTEEHFYLSQADISPDAIIRNSSAYAFQMGNTYESYFKLLNGDADTAKKMLQKNVSLTYGDTYVNGKKEYTYLPIEKVLNLPEDSIGVIQSDMSKQLTEQLTHTKSLYDAGRSDFYWEVRPKQNINDVHEEIKKLKQKGFEGKSLAAQDLVNRFNKNNGVEVIRHWRGAPPERYETVLQANPYSTMTTNLANPVSGGWEIMLKSDKGVQSISLMDPIAGVVTYRPDTQKLQAQNALLHVWMRH